MKVSALFFLCLISIALAVPVDHHAPAETQLTLADLEREQNEPLIDTDQLTDLNDQDVARSKRFILAHKIALAKALKLGIG